MSALRQFIVHFEDIREFGLEIAKLGQGQANDPNTGKQ